MSLRLRLWGCWVVEVVHEVGVSRSGAHNVIGVQPTLEEGAVVEGAVVIRGGS